MRRLQVLTVALGLAVVVVALRAAELPKTVTDPYLRIQAALASDTFDGVKADAGALAAEAAKLGASAKALEAASRELESSADIKAARTAFGKVSDALMAYVEATGATLPSGVQQAFCPMVKKPWLQKGDKISNPYYGKSMLDCGFFKRTK